MKNFDFNWTFPVVIGFAGAIYGLIYLSQQTQVGWAILIGASVVIAGLAAVASTGLKKRTPTPQSSSEGQGPKVNLAIAVFIIMLIASLGVCFLGYNQR